MSINKTKIFRHIRLREWNWELKVHMIQSVKTLQNWHGFNFSNGKPGSWIVGNVLVSSFKKQYSTKTWHSGWRGIIINKNWKTRKTGFPNVQLWHFKGDITRNSRRWPKIGLDNWDSFYEYLFLMEKHCYTEMKILSKRPVTFSFSP